MSRLARKLREKRNRPPAHEPWVWLTRELLESEAWQSLSRAGLRVVFRLMVENMAHAGTENGNLIVTYADFVKFGVRQQTIKSAIAETVTRGLIIVTEKGRSSTGPDRWPSKYALGWLPMSDGSPAANRWKGWQLPRRAGPIGGNIESTVRIDSRENGGKYRALLSETTLAPVENDTREMAETNKSPLSESTVGKMRSAGSSEGIL